jgi:1,3-beta-glucan synthase
MLVVFLALIIGPLVAGKQIPDSTFTSVNDIMSSLKLVQPVVKDRDDTLGSSQTGTGDPSYTGWGTRTRSSTSEAGAAVTTSAGADAAKIRLF